MLEGKDLRLSKQFPMQVTGCQTRSSLQLEARRRIAFRLNFRSDRPGMSSDIRQWIVDSGQWAVGSTYLAHFHPRGRRSPIAMSIYREKA